MISRPRITMAEMIEVSIDSPEVAGNGDAARDQPHHLKQ
jgi:hypothetical protein